MIMDKEIRVPVEPKTATPAAKPKMATALKDIIVFASVTILVFILSYFFDVFSFIVGRFEQNPRALKSLDEIITLLVTLSIGFAIFSWRRWRETKKESAQCISLQQELLDAAETKAAVERIISRQLRSDMDDLKQAVKEMHHLLTCQKKIIP
ncbi:MAG: hypothetical protein PHQ96_09530 [Candidatus Omnitrophica bacterium]|nr:hypothetical protein [Candidatus Omnitrophota bacterium]